MHVTLHSRHPVEAGWFQRLELMVEAVSLLQKTLEAFASDRFEDGRRALDGARLALSTNARIRPFSQEAPPKTSSEFAAMKQIKPAVEEMVRLRDEVSALLKGREKAASLSTQGDALSDRELLDIADGWIPTAWDASKDVLFISGSDRSRLAALFQERGYARVWTVSGSDSGADDASDLATEDASALARQLLSSPPDQWLFIPAGEPDKGFDPVPLSKNFRSVFIASALGRNTQRKFGRMWAQQLVRNLPYLSNIPTLSQVSVDFSGTPCLIVCPGPSLKKNIHLLGQAKGKAIIIAVNHAAHAVFAAGVVPDIIIAVDPTDLILPHFDGLDLSEVSATVLSTAVDPRLFELPGARRFMSISINGAADAFLSDLGVPLTVLPCGGSVAHAAFSTARFWQCSPIALVGQDLAYTGGENYLSGTHGRITHIDGRGQQVVSVKGQNGETLIAPMAFDAFRLWYEMAAEIEEDVVLMNCTEGGAHIEGFQNAPLERFIAMCADQNVDVEEHLGAHWGPSDESQRNQVRQHVRTRLSRLRQASNATDDCLKAVNALAMGQLTENKLRRVEKQMRARVRGLPEVTLFLQKELGKTIEATAVGQQADRALTQTAELYEGVAEALSTMTTDYRAINDLL